MGAKVIIGMVMGFIVDAALRLARRDRQNLRIHELCARDKMPLRRRLRHLRGKPARLRASRRLRRQLHSTSITSMITATITAGRASRKARSSTHGAGRAFHLHHHVGPQRRARDGREDALAAFVGSNSVAAVFASALVGLIPNCAASVVIAQLYVEGVLGAGAMLSGLLVSAGIGLLVLARTNRHVKENLVIVGILYATGVAWGLVVNALGIVF